MTMKSFFRLLFFTIIILACASSLRSEVIKQTDEPKSDLERLNTIWETQRSALNSGIFHCRELHRKVPDGHNTTLAEVIKLLAKPNLLDDEAVFREVAGSLDPRIRGQQPPWSKASYTISQNGYLADIVPSGNPGHHQLQSQYGLYEVLKRPFGPRYQVTIFLPGHAIPPALSLEDFLFIPSPKILEKADLIINQVEEDKNCVRLSTPHAEVVVDRLTGFVRKSTYGKHGTTIYQETRQSLPITFDDGVILPKLYFMGRYREDRLSSFRLRVIDEAKPNVEIPAETFLIAASTKDVVVDQTKGKPKVFQPPYPTIDVLEFMDSEQ